jgi:hypothetical protein
MVGTTSRRIALPLARVPGLRAGPFFQRFAGPNFHSVNGKGWKVTPECHIFICFRWESQLTLRPPKFIPARVRDTQFRGLPRRDSNPSVPHDKKYHCNR